MFQLLYVCNQPLCCLSKWALWGFTALKALRFELCYIDPVPNIHPVAHTLEHLIMESNQMSYLPNTMFLGCKYLTRLSLSFNNFKSIPNISDVSDTLLWFSISSNKVADVSALYEAPFPRLVELKLSHNRITYFPDHPSGWNRLSQLYLRYNLIKSISSNFLLTSEHVVISADHNPWHCDQGLCWTQQCNLTLVYQFYRCSSNCTWHGEMICASPQRWKGQDAMHAGNSYT